MVQPWRYCSPLHPTRHLGCGPAREGHQQNAARVGAIDDKMRDAMGERIGFARTRSGNNKKRHVGVQPCSRTPCSTARRCSLPERRRGPRNGRAFAAHCLAEPIRRFEAAGGALAYNVEARPAVFHDTRQVDLDQRWWGGTVMGELFKILFALASHNPEQGWLGVFGAHC